jgi:hypothetical protein
MIGASLADPVMLVCLAGAFLGALGLSWARCLIGMFVLTIGRTIITDYQNFAPGVPPSPTLLYVFTSTLLGMCMVFAAVKCARVFLRAAWVWAA